MNKEQGKNSNLAIDNNFYIVGSYTRWSNVARIGGCRAEVFLIFIYRCKRFQAQSAVGDRNILQDLQSVLEGIGCPGSRT